MTFFAVRRNSVDVDLYPTSKLKLQPFAYDPEVTAERALRRSVRLKTFSLRQLQYEGLPDRNFDEVDRSINLNPAHPGFRCSRHRPGYCCRRKIVPSNNLRQIVAKRFYPRKNVALMPIYQNHIYFGHNILFCG